MEEKAKILIIDDEEGIRDMLSYVLKQAGYSTITAENGKVGVTKARENEIDLVITDIKMPDMDGIKVLEEIKKLNPETEVIMATGYVTVETAVESLRKGAFDYISKPFNLDEMLIVVEKALEHRHLKRTVIKDEKILERLRELDEMKTGFLSNVVHELRTPLMSIRNSMDLLKDEFDGDPDASSNGLAGRLPGSLSESGIKLLEICIRNAFRMNNLLKELMDFSKMESGTFEIKKNKILLKPVIDETISEMNPIAGVKKITLIPDISGDIKEINADHDRIKQVLINLIGNAIKFTPEGGSIKVKTEVGSRKSLVEKNKSLPLPTSDLPLTDFIMVSVIDTGMGISQENLKKIFQKFYQVKGTESCSITGIGLGLSIAKSIVEAHGGKIWVESPPGDPDVSFNEKSGCLPGKGSKFSFTLPI